MGFRGGPCGYLRVPGEDAMRLERFYCRAALTEILAVTVSARNLRGRIE